MKKNQYKWVITFITITIVITICAQIYSNIKHYKTNKQELLKQVQISLDNAVDAYYVNVAKGGVLSLTTQDSENPSKTTTDTLRFKDRFSGELKASIDSTINSMIKKDSTKTYVIESKDHRKRHFRKIYSNNTKLTKQLEKLISKVYISFTRDSLNLEILNPFIEKELARKNIHFRYALSYTRHDSKKDTLITATYKYKNFPKEHLTTSSSSSYLPHRGGQLKILFTDETVLVLKRSLMEIVLSLLLSVSIISCLLYLLKTIHKQKKIAIIKNDLISNITHEFKTPIATISAALEGIKNFNDLNDPSKTEKYLNMSSEQLHKLNIMVEKLLDTATLHSNDLKIQPENIDLILLLKKIVLKHSLISPEKDFSLDTSLNSLDSNIDVFHFENAVDNILDNAVKYGGSIIKAKISTRNNSILIRIQDNGIGIKSNYASKVFDQFFRIPTGNIHDTKGFGIGLYYTKKIIEKHGGTISIDLNNKKFTTFIIEMKK